MKKRLALLACLLVAGVAACDSADQPTEVRTPGSGPAHDEIPGLGSGGGKTDTIPKPQSTGATSGETP